MSVVLLQQPELRLFVFIYVLPQLAVPLLIIYLEKTRILKDTCSPVFTAALFTIDRTRKRTRCPLTDEWIKKLLYLYPMEFHSGIKRNKFELVKVRWMNLKTVIQSEGSHSEKENK